MGFTTPPLPSSKLPGIPRNAFTDGLVEQYRASEDVLEYLGEVMAESMDIVKRIDEDASMGPALLKGSPDALRADIKAWQKKHAVLSAPPPLIVF